MRKSRFLVFLLIVSVLTVSVVNADVFQYGSKGAEVVTIQLKLKELGFFNDTAIGFYGTRTQDAVKRFQVKNGFIATGTVDAKLFERLVSIKGTSSSVANTVSDTINFKKLTRDEIKYCQDVLQRLGYYSGKLDGIYGTMTSAAIKKFQASFGIKVSGNIDETTFNKVIEEAEKLHNAAITSRGAITRDKPGAQSSTADNEASTDESITEAVVTETAPEIEILDWWTGASDVFYLGAVANVIDVRTGLSFKLVRTYGTNHADCEALTKEDSNIIKAIWGGEWSWNRRPIIIEIDGRRLAASMAAMPHAGLDSEPANKHVDNRSAGYGTGFNLDKIKNNDMDGHIDVHFLNSRTHGTNVINEAHQNAIFEAAGIK